MSLDFAFFEVSCFHFNCAYSGHSFREFIKVSGSKFFPLILKHIL